MRTSYLWGFIIIFSSACTNQPQRSQTGDALFKWEGKIYKKSELPDDVRAQVYEAERKYYDDVSRSIEDYVVKTYVKKLAENEKKDPAEYHNELVSPKEPSDQELLAYYEANKAKIPYPFAQIKEELRRFLRQEEGFNKQKDLLIRAKNSGAFELLLGQPESPEFKIDIKDRPFKGLSPEKSKITIVEFADYKCPHCGATFKDLEALWPEIQSKASFVFMDFPLQANGLSETIARGARCAQKQNKFWEYHDEAYRNQNLLTADWPAQTAQKLGLNTPEFEQCIVASDTAAFVKQSQEMGKKVGVKGTPTFYINGKRTVVDIGLKTIRADINKIE